jgi:hypothetical protein
MTPPTGARRWVLVPGTAAAQDNLRRYRLARLEAIAFAETGVQPGQDGERAVPVAPGPAG